MRAAVSVHHPSRVAAVPLRRPRAAAVLLAAGLAAALAGCAQSASPPLAVQLRVGETRQLGIWGGHRRDCVTSVPPSSVEVTTAPRLGTLSERHDVPYVAANSISGTCDGSRFLGTAVDYTARAPGTDTVALEPIFSNGTKFQRYSVTVLP